MASTETVSVRRTSNEQQNINQLMVEIL